MPTTDSATPNADLSRWLRLREAADAAARSSALLAWVRPALPAGRPVRIVDLGTGAGSNLRYLVPRLPQPQRWLVVDRGEDLLADLLTRTAPWAEARSWTATLEADRLVLAGAGVDVRVETRQQDLGPIGDLSIFDGCDLVTASALLDLVSSSWLDGVASHCRRARAAALFTIVYSGRSTSSPPEPGDALVLDLFNRHQRTDKGLGGVAAGPDATAAAQAAFRRAGYTVNVAASDWAIGPEAREMQHYLIEGWASAASEIAPVEAGRIAGWKSRRLAHVDEGRSHLTVGHFDLAAIP